MTWKSMETAPKDQTILLAYDSKQILLNNNVYTGYHNYDIDLWVPTFSGDLGMSWAKRNQPIAWMELPEFK